MIRLPHLSHLIFSPLFLLTPLWPPRPSLCYWVMPGPLGFREYILFPVSGCFPRYFPISSLGLSSHAVSSESPSMTMWPKRVPDSSLLTLLYFPSHNLSLPDTLNICLLMCLSSLALSGMQASQGRNYFWVTLGFPMPRIMPGIP